MKGLSPSRYTYMHVTVYIRTYSPYHRPGTVYGSLGLLDRLGLIRIMINDCRDKDDEMY